MEVNLAAFFRTMRRTMGGYKAITMDPWRKDFVLGEPPRTESQEPAHWPEPDAGPLLSTVRALCSEPPFALG